MIIKLNLSHMILATVYLCLIIAKCVPSTFTLLNQQKGKGLDVLKFKVTSP